MKFASLSLVALATVLLLANEAAGKVVYKSCKGPTPVGVINSVAISDCTVSPCKLQRGKNYTITVNFTSGESTDQAYADVHGILAGVPVEFPLPQKDACKSGVACPVEKGASYVYVATLPILKAYPAVSVVVEWALNDAQKGGGNEIWCFETPVTVIN